MKFTKLILLLLTTSIALENAANAATAYVYRVPNKIDQSTAGASSGTAGSLSVDKASLALTAAAGDNAFGQLTLTNKGSTAITGLTLELAPSTSELIIAQGCASTTLAPQASCSTLVQFSPTRAGTTVVTFKAQASGSSMSVPITATGTANPSTTQVTQVLTSAATMPADGTSSVELYASVQDAYGNTVGPGAAVTWTTSLGSLASSSTQTNASGIATNTLTSGSTPGVASITAKGQLAASATASVTITASAETRYDGAYNVYYDGGTGTGATWYFVWGSTRMATAKGGVNGNYPSEIATICGVTGPYQKAGGYYYVAGALKVGGGPASNSAAYYAITRCAA